MNIMGHKKIWFIISGIMVLISILSLSIWHLKLGLDFTGGALLEIKLSKSANQESIKNILAEQKIEAIVSSTGGNQFLIKSKELDDKQKQNFIQGLSKKYGKVEELSFRSVGPTISKDLTRKSFLAVIVASLIIIIYVAYAFRKVSKQISAWRFGICAVIALIHDALIVMGVFAILGKFLKVEVDSLFVTAVLTVISFSVHDTIVIYDRIRENLKKLNEDDLDKVANISIIEMLPRDIATSFVIILVLLSLFLFGGETTKYFALAILIGMFVGTYSSIFVASALAVGWQKIADRKIELK